VQVSSNSGESIGGRSAVHKVEYLVPIHCGHNHSFYLSPLKIKHVSVQVENRTENYS